MSEPLYVKTFGGFRMIYQGKVINGDHKGRDSHFTRLMEVLLHEGEKGVSRAHLEEILFEESDLTDVRHMLRSVIYNSKQKLKKAGLPQVNYIRNEDGMYYWTDEIPVIEDAAEFEEQYETAEKEKDPELKLHLYVESAHMYAGDFLPEQTRFVWVAQEDRRYRAMFCQSVEKAVEIMRERQAYLSMEALGKYAVSRQPFADWETIIMEALISMERYDEATRLYEDTVAYYMEEMGMRPSLEMMELLDQMTEQISYQYGLLDDIQEKLSGRNENEMGGYYCSYPVFRGVYRMIERIIERGGQSVYLMLCTMVDKDGTPVTDEKQLDRMIGKLGDVICGSIRQSDAVCRYGKNQYLVLLVNTTRENCAIVEDRIDRHFLMDQKRVRIRYHVNSLADTEKGSRS